MSGRLLIPVLVLLTLLLGLISLGIGTLGLDYAGWLGGETSGTFKAQLQAVFETEDGRVIGLHRNVGERDGNKLDTMCSLLLEVSDEQIKSGTEYFLDLQNWDRFWS